MIQSENPNPKGFFEIREFGKGEKGAMISSVEPKVNMLFDDMENYCWMVNVGPSCEYGFGR